MNRRNLLATGAAAIALGSRRARAQSAPVKIVFWHSMTGALGEELAKLVAGFNASQHDTVLEGVFKGGYADSLTAAIAAFRAGEAPHLVQVFEVGTGTMLAAGKAVKQTWELSQETGVAIDPAGFVPPVRGYYSLPDGRMASMPFNSSTAIMWFNKDALAKAGADPAHPPATWQELISVLKAVKAKGASDIAMTTSWPTWIQLEEFAALHDLPYATRANGFDGLDTELLINKPAFVHQVDRLLGLSRDGLFKYGGRDSAADPLLISGQAAVTCNSSGMRGDLVKSAKFAWGAAFLPYDPDLIAEPKNSIIGGASLWTMTREGRTPEEYKAVANFLAFLARPENAASWHQRTGYVPVTTAGYETTKAAGFYAANPGSDVPIRQLERGAMTNNSRGLRLGRLPEIRSIIQEELEGALQGNQTAQVAMDKSVERGNRVLRAFEKSVRT